MFNKICKECGNPFSCLGAATKTCSTECHYKYEIKYRRKYYKTVGYVGERRLKILKHVSMYQKEHKEQIKKYIQNYKKSEKYKTRVKDRHKTPNRKKYMKMYYKKIKELGKTREYDIKRAQTEKRKKWNQLYSHLPSSVERRKFLNKTKYKLRIKQHIQKRRALIRQATIGEVDLKWINERDKFCCQICLKKVNFKAKDIRHPDYPNYHHLCKLADGGEHSNMNLSLVHYSCHKNLHSKKKTEIQQNLF